MGDDSDDFQVIPTAEQLREGTEENIRRMLKGRGMSPYAIEKRKTAITDLLAANPEGWNVKLIREMKQLGMKRPECIPSPDWTSHIEHWEPVHDVICYMAAWGVSSAEIARSVGKSADWTAKFTKTAAALDKIEAVQLKLWGQEPKKWFEAILPEAVKTAYGVMKDDEEKGVTRADIAFRFMDRALGKPKETHHVQHVGIRALFEELDAMKKGRTLVVDGQVIEDAQIVDSESTAKVEEITPSDSITQWVEDNL